MRLLKGKFVQQKQALLRSLYTVRYFFFRPSFPVNSDGKVYLNLGCGPSTSSEFVNIDAVPQSHTHYVADIQHLFMFPSNSVDLIYASHVIEHIPRSELDATLKEWLRVLVPGGILRFGVPDFDQLIKAYQQSDRDIDSIVNQLMGQGAPYDDHHSIWNREYAEHLLKRVGFSDVRKWSPETVKHHLFFDKTGRELEINGEFIPISLNLEAMKE